MIKIFNKLGISGDFVNLVRGVHKKPQRHHSNDERLNTFLLRSGYLPLLVNIVLEILAREIRQENEMKGIHIERKK